MTTKLEQKELDILRHAVDKAEKIQQRQIINNPDVKRIIEIVEKFIIDKKCICYGGTAINNIIPLEDQFYDKSLEIPDYDFFSNNAMEQAIELANIYHEEGFDEVEAKAGVHFGTYKVFVNFIPVADITQLTREIFTKIKQKAIIVNKIAYAPPNFLRMSMYLELSRPKGDVSRWEKVLKRLMLLNKHYPIVNNKCLRFISQRKLDYSIHNGSKLFSLIRKNFQEQGLVFFGGYANHLYSNYMPKYLRNKLKNYPDFDVLSEDPRESAMQLKHKLVSSGYKNIHLILHNGIGEIIAPHYEIQIENDTVAFIYEPIACHSYNEININKKTMKIATIDTMLSFYLAFIYSNRSYYDENRIVCMAHRLFIVQNKNKLSQKGLLKRFSINCYGTQSNKETLRAEKNKMYQSLKKNPNSREYKEWFLKYNPNKNSTKKKTDTKNKTKKK